MVSLVMFWCFFSTTKYFFDYRVITLHPFDLLRHILMDLCPPGIILVFLFSNCWHLLRFSFDMQLDPPLSVVVMSSYFTNTLILPVINGPTEGLMLIYLCHFFTSFVGIPVYQAVLYLMIAFAVLPTVAFNIQNVYGVVKLRKGSMLLALAMLYPFAVLMAGVLVWDYLSPSDIFGNYPHLVVMGTGLAFGFLVGRMILSHLCDEPKGLKTSMCMSLLYLPLAIANALTAKLNDGVPLIDELLVLVGYCAFTGFLYLHLATSVIHEITTALGIYCFRITRKEA
ncbi:Choline/ethanolaminephosphotransferase 1 [Bienertia sinuspersici]